LELKLIRRNNPICEPVSIVMGNLDGLHLAHRRLIEDCIRDAKAQGRKSAVLTFMPHPREFFYGQGPERILPHDIKDSIMERMGVDYLVIQDFNEEVANMEPEAFLRDIVLQRLKSQHVAVGFNYHFGRKQQGDVNLLRKLSEKYGFSLAVQGEMRACGNRISSTAIRDYINNGDMENAACLLGYYPLLQGRVEKGEQLGRILGFPTANITLRENLLAPKNGVYAGWVRTGEGTFRGIINIGTKPTVGDHFHRNIEAHLLNFQGDLYGQNIRIAFTRRLREETRFGGLEELKAQLARDREEACRLVAEESRTLALFPDDLY